MENFGNCYAEVENQIRELEMYKHGKENLGTMLNFQFLVNLNVKMIK